MLLPTVFAGAENWDLNDPLRSPRAKRLRKEARALWKLARPTCDRIAAVDTGEKKKTQRRWGEKKKEEPKEVIKPEDIDREAVAAAVENLEFAALKFERSLKIAWNNKANTTLCTVIKAWFAAQPYLPKPPEYKDDKERKKAESKARTLRTKQIGGARKLSMQYGTARRYVSLYRRCPRCEGRKDLRNALDKRIYPCPLCKRTGRHVNRKGVYDARWMFKSPFYRADSRRQLELNRKLRLAHHDIKRLAPFVKSVSIKGKPEFNGSWIRITAREQRHYDAAGRKLERKDVKYQLWRMGKLWFFYNARYDKQIIDIPEEPDPDVDEDDEDED